MANLYINTITGSDSNNGTSSGTAKKTVTGLLGVTNNSDTIFAIGDVDFASTSTSLLSGLNWRQEDGSISSLTLDASHLASFASIGGKGDFHLLVTGANADLDGIALTATGGYSVQTVELVGSGTVQTLSLTGSQLQNLSQIIGTPDGSDADDKIVITDGNADIRALSLVDIETITLDDTGNDPQTLTVSAGQVAGMAITSGNTGNTTLTTVASLDLRGSDVSDLDDILFGTAATGATLTVDGDTELGDGQDINGTDNGRIVLAEGYADFSDTNLQNVTSVSMTEEDARQMIGLTGAQAQGMVSITGSLSGEDENDDALVIVTGNTNLSAVTLTGIDEIQLGTPDDDGFQSLVLKGSQAAGLSAIYGNAESDTHDDVVRFNEGDVDLSNVDLFELASINLTQVSHVQTLTLNGDNEIDIDAINGTRTSGAKDDHLVLKAGDLEFGQKAITNFVDLKMTEANAAQTVTLRAVDADGMATISGTLSNGDADDTLAIGLGSLDLSDNTLTNLSELSLVESDAAQSVTLEGGQAGGFDAITGTQTSGDNDDVLVIDDNDADFSDTDVTYFAAINLTEGNTQQILTLKGVDAEDADTIAGTQTGGADDDDLVISEGDADLSGNTLINLDKLTLSEADAVQTISLSGTQAAGFSAIEGTQNSSNANDDVLDIASGSADLSDVTLTNLTEITLTQAATAQTLTLTGDQFDALDKVTGTQTAGSNDDILAVNEGDVDFADTTVTDIARVNLTEVGAEQTLTLTGEEAEDIATIAGTQTGITDDDDLVIASGSADLSTGHTLTNLDTLTLSQANAAQTIGLAGTDAAGFSAIIGTQTAGANDDVLEIGSGNANLTGVTLTNLAEIALTQAATVQTLTLTGDQFDALDKVTGTQTAISNDDVLTITEGDVDFANATVTNIATVNLTETNAEQTLTLTGEEAEALSTIAGTQNISSVDDDDLVISEGDADLSGHTLTNLDTLTLSEVNAAQTITLTAAQATGFTAISGTQNSASENDDTLIIDNGDADLSGITLSNLGEIELTQSNTTQTLTLTGTQAGDLDAITGTETSGSDDDILVIDAGNADLSETDVTNFARINLTEAGAQQVLTLKGVDAEGADTIAGTQTGGTDDDDLVIASGNADLSENTLLNLDTLSLSAASTAQTVMLTAAQAEAFTSISGTLNGSTLDDTLEIASGNADLSGITLSNLSEIELTQSNTAQTLTLTGTQAGDLDAITGTKTGGSDDDILVIDAGNADLSETDVTNFVRINLTQSNTGQVLTLKGADAEGADTIAGTQNISSVDDDDLVIASGNADLSGNTLLNLDTLSLSAAATAQTVTLTAAQAEAFTSISGTLNGSTKDDKLFIDDGDADLDSITLSNLANISLTEASTAQTLTLTGNQAAAFTSITGTKTSAVNDDTLTITANDADLSQTDVTNIATLNLQGTGAQTLTLKGENAQAIGTIAGTQTASTDDDNLVIASGNADLSGNTLLNLNTLSLSAASTAQTVTLTAAQAEAFTSISGTLNGSTKDDKLFIDDGDADLDSITLSNLANISLTEASTAQTLTLTGNQAAAFTSITGTKTSAVNDDTLTITANDADLSQTDVTNIAAINLQGVGQQVLTLKGENAQAIGTISGTQTVGADDDDLVIVSGNADLSGNTLTNLDTLTLSAASTAQTVTLTAAQAEAFTSISGTLNGSTLDDKLVIDTGSADLSSKTLSNLHTLSLTGSGIQTITLSETQAEGLKAITGTRTGSSNDDVLVINSGTEIDLTGVDLTGISEIQLTGSGAQTLKLTKAQVQALSKITGTQTLALDDDHLVVTDDLANLTNVTLTRMAPTIRSTSPADGSTRVTPGSSIVLTMTEVVTASIGSVTLYRAGSPPVAIGATVTVDGDKVTIDPTDNLTVGQSYYVELGTGAFVDGDGATSSAIGAGIFNFKVHAVSTGGGGGETPPTNAGPDTITGGDASETIDAGNDNDLVNAGAGNDTVFGGLGNDTVTAGSGDDLVTAGDGADLVYGNQGDDIVYGNQGDDTLFGGQNGDTLFGGQNDDAVYGNFGDDAVYGNLGNDVLFGGQDNDQVFGGQGNDQLFGNVGDDTLFGNLGDDTLTGGAGADVFTFGAQGGADTVTDFDFAAGDRLSVGGRSWNVDSNGAGDAVLSFTDGSSITLRGVQSGAVNSSWFVTA